MLRRWLPILAVVALFSGATFADDRVHVWVKAFIPRDHPGNPGYIFAVPGHPGQFILHEPAGAYCAATDSRSFSNDPAASARLTTEFVLTVNGQVVIGPSGPRPMFVTGLSHRVDCTTGADVMPPQRAPTSGMHVGQPAFAEGVAQVVFDGRASYPFIPLAPEIQYGGTVTFNVASRALRFQGSTKMFPAYEAYAQLNDGPIAALFRLPPGAGTTVVSLLELGTGLQQRAIDITVALADGRDPLLALIGSWRGSMTGSDDPMRLTFAQSGTSVRVQVSSDGETINCGEARLTPARQIAFTCSSGGDAATFTGALSADRRTLAGNVQTPDGVVGWSVTKE